MAILETKDATMRFGGLTAVDHLNIHVDEGEIVSIIGPNGAGKTTCFNMITGINRPTEGDIFFLGKRINGMRPDQIAKLGIARTFQNIRLFNKMTVLDNVFVANHVKSKRGLFAQTFCTPAAMREERMMYQRSLDVLETVGLIDYKDWLAPSLPYGLQRRLEIARALVAMPKLLMVDEPAAGMNPKESEDLAEFIFDIRAKYQISVLLIEHHMKLVMKISNRIYVEQFGKTAAEGTPEEIRANPTVIKAYLGEED